MGFIKDIKEKLKEKNKFRKEIEDIKKQAYYEAMKEKAVDLGKSQAELEAKHRKILFEKKLEELRKKKDKQTKEYEHPNVFGLNKNKSDQKEEFDWLGRKYIQ